MSAKEINENLLDDLIRIVRSGGDFSAARHHILFWLSKADQLQDEITRLHAQLKMAKKALEEANHITYISEKAGGLNGWIFVAGHMRKIIRAALKELEADE
jgi:hypothetical protein